MNDKIKQIIEELDDLYGEAHQRARIGDVDPETTADQLCEVMRLFGRALAAIADYPAPNPPLVQDAFPKVARG